MPPLRELAPISSLHRLAALAIFDLASPKQRSVGLSLSEDSDREQQMRAAIGSRARPSAPREDSLAEASGEALLNPRNLLVNGATLRDQAEEP
jgi:hypothetical protein